MGGRLLLALVATARALQAPRRRTLRAPAVASTVPRYEPGEKTAVKLTPGAQPKKLRKKQRRSRSPVLYPCTTADGREGLLQLAADQAHIAREGGAVAAFVSQHDDHLILSPTPAEARRREVKAPRKPPANGRLLGDLRKNERVEAVVLRMLSKDTAYVSVRDVFRPSKGGFRRQGAVLNGADRVAVGEGIEAFVKLAAPQSGRLTLATAPVTDVKHERTLKRLRKQWEKGTLAAGRVRVATVASVHGNLLEVDAGGLRASVDAPDAEGPYEAGQRVMVRIASLDPETLAASLEYVPAEALYEEDLEKAGPEA